MLLFHCCFNDCFRQTFRYPSGCFRASGALQDNLPVHTLTVASGAQIIKTTLYKTVNISNSAYSSTILFPAVICNRH